MDFLAIMISQKTNQPTYVFKPFKQTIWCLLKGCNKIIHVIGNHVWSIAIHIAGNVHVIYSKKQIW